MSLSLSIDNEAMDEKELYCCVCEKIWHSRACDTINLLICDSCIDKGYTISAIPPDDDSPNSVGLSLSIDNLAFKVDPCIAIRSAEYCTGTFEERFEPAILRCDVYCKSIKGRTVAVIDEKSSLEWALPRRTCVLVDMATVRNQEFISNNMIELRLQSGKIIPYTCIRLRVSKGDIYLVITLAEFYDNNHPFSRPVEYAAPIDFINEMVNEIRSMHIGD